MMVSIPRMVAFSAPNLRTARKNALVSPALTRGAQHPRGHRKEPA